MRLSILCLVLLFGSLTARAETDPVGVRLVAAMDAYVAGDFKGARARLEPLADLGLAQAQTMLGILYWHGRGVPENPALAALYFVRAADQGFAEAQLALSEAYERGRGVPVDNGEAYMWARLVERTGTGDLLANARARSVRLAQDLPPQEIVTLDRRVAAWRPRPRR